MIRNRQIYLIQGGYGNRLIIYSHIKNVQNISQNPISLIIHKRCNASIMEPKESINLNCPVNRKIDFIAFYLEAFLRRIGLKVVYSIFFKFFLGKIHKGYYQDKKLFADELSKYNSYHIEEQFNPYGPEAIIIHVRRGDYYSERFIKQYGGICDIEYYKDALNLLKEKIGYTGQKIVIVSDDPSWVSENLHFQNMIIHNSKSYMDDWNLMKNSKNLIISNSTFSLTAAWAGDVENVFYPNKWDHFTGDKTNILFKKKWRKVERK